MSKQQTKEKVIVTNKDVEQDIKIRNVEDVDKDILAVQKALVDMVYKKVKEKELDGDIDIKPDAEKLAKELDLSVERVKECVGELHKQEWLRNGREEGSVKVDQFLFKVIRKGYTLCPFCGQEAEFVNETQTDRWGKVDPEGNYVNWRYNCLNKACKHTAIIEARVEAKII